MPPSEFAEPALIDYKLNQPHTSLDGLTPNEFATRPPRTAT